MTETGMNTSNPLAGERRPGTVGPALPGIELRVRGADDALLGPGEVGVLEVRGPNVFGGYWRMPEKTAEAMTPDGFFVTGDMAEIAADGYVTIVGRAKDLIISGGLNVYPKEVELAIDALPGVVESAVIGVPHPDFGEAVVAVIAAKGDPGDVVGALREGLAAFKLPKHVAVIDDLPRNAMGKVQKGLLRERFAGLFAG
jgi:malonyl-CoA/methylmalonyl-CoA synthetase